MLCLLDEASLVHMDHIQYMQGFFLYSFSGKEEEDPLAEVSKQTLAILNKLTPQKFDTLIVKFNQIKIDSEEKLRRCIDLVFDKVSLCKS